MKVKICGITNLEDAIAGSELGADALGFIFVKSSPRYIPPEHAEHIIKELPPFITKVGVFADATKDEIREIVYHTHVNCLQLHGSETPEFAKDFDIPVIKSFRVTNGFNTSILSKYTVSAFLLDTFVKDQLGGTGKTFDWNIAIEAKKYGRIILAGGLNEYNVLEAIKTVQPYAIDVNSGAESTPGKKDVEKLKRLFDIIGKLKTEIS